MHATADYPQAMLPGMLLTGIGVGLTLPTLIGIGVSALPAHHFSTGSGVIIMARQLGSVLGVAILVAILDHIHTPTTGNVRTNAGATGNANDMPTNVITIVPYDARSPGALSVARKRIGVLRVTSMESAGAHIDAPPAASTWWARRADSADPSSVALGSYGNADSFVRAATLIGLAAGVEL